MLRSFGMMRAYPDAFAAVYTALRYDLRLAIADAYCLRRAAFYAVCTANAFILIQRDRMKKTIHGILPPMDFYEIPV